MQILNCGIYIIECNSNCALYVGQSSNIRSRWSDHRKSLKVGRHHNKFLQACYDKYGAASILYKRVIACSVPNLPFYEQLIADGYRRLGVELFNTGDYLTTPARGRSRKDNSDRLKAMHSNPATQALLLRGVLARAARIKGTQEAIDGATLASRSRTPKPAHERKSKHRALMLRRGTAEHSAMVSALMKQHYKDGKIKPRTGGKPMQRLDTGEIFESMAALAKVIGTTKEALYYHIKRGGGVCKGVPVAAFNDSSVQTVKL